MDSKPANPTSISTTNRVQIFGRLDQIVRVKGANAHTHKLAEN